MFCDGPSLIRITIAGLACLFSSSPLLLAQQPVPEAQSQAVTNTAPAAEVETPKIPNDQLDSLVAPIALYPDPLVAQILAASTYPLEIIQLEQWMTNNKTLKDKALADAVAKLPFDPSVQSLAAFPDVIKQLGEQVSWTMDLGNAFLAQQTDVMDAIQRMRAKAQGTGNLKTTAQQEVETQTVEGGKQVIVIQPADPEVVYVPQYSPTVVYGPPVYPYPYVYPPGYGLLAFGTGIALGAAWGSNWGNCNWGGGDITINNNNNFNRNNNTNINRGQGNRAGQGGAGNGWSHNPSHRGGAPYGDRGTADKFGGRARQQPAGGAGNRASPGGRVGSGGLGGGQGLGGGNRPGGAGNLGGASGLGGGNRPSVGAGAGGVGVGNRPGGGAGVSTRPAGGSSFGGGDRVGNRSVSGGSGFGSSSSAFGGGGVGGGSARAASNRGGQSMGGGGMSSGGGGGRGGGGGGRGGGGGGRR